MEEYRKMEVRVMSRPEFIKYCGMEHTDAGRCVAISISSIDELAPDVTLNEHSGIEYILPVFLNDTDSSDEEAGGINVTTAWGIARFCLMAQANNINKIIVHCGAGVSRSAGVAGAILKYFNNDDAPIFNNPKYYPNMLCYRMVLEQLMSESLVKH